MQTLNKIRKSFVQGIQMLVSPIGVRNARLKKMHNRSDADALASDWIAVGNDIRGAMVAYGQSAVK